MTYPAQSQVYETLTEQAENLAMLPRVSACKRQSALLVRPLNPVGFLSFVFTMASQVDSGLLTSPLHFVDAMMPKS